MEQRGKPRLSDRSRASVLFPVPIGPIRITSVFIAVFTGAENSSHRCLLLSSGSVVQDDRTIVAHADQLRTKISDSRHHVRLQMSVPFNEASIPGRHTLHYRVRDDHKCHPLSNEA